MLKKTIVNLFLVGWFAILFIDAAPHVSESHSKADLWLDRYLDVTGLWQGGWELFAPQPDKVNAGIEAKVEFSDGSTVVWNTPDWRSMSALDRFLRFREAEYVDSIRMESNYVALSDYAQFLARSIEHPDDPDAVAKTIVLTHRWVDIPKPNSGNIELFPETPEFEKSFVLFADDVKPDPAQSEE